MDNLEIDGDVAAQHAHRRNRLRQTRTLGETAAALAFEELRLIVTPLGPAGPERGLGPAA